MNPAYPQMKLPMAKKDDRNDKRAEAREKCADHILENWVKHKTRGIEPYYLDSHI